MILPPIVIGIGLSRLEEKRKKKSVDKTCRTLYPVSVGHIYYNAGAVGMLIQVLAFVRLQYLPEFDLQLCNCSRAGTKIESVRTLEIGYFLTSSLCTRNKELFGPFLSSS